MNLTIGILAALRARDVIGKGQRVDVSLVDSVVSSLETGTQRYLENNEEPELMGNRYASAYPYDSFKAKDGQFVIGCGNDNLYDLLCERVLMREDLCTDEKFSTNNRRCENYAELKPEIEKWSINYTIEEAVEILLDAGVPAAPIYGFERIMKDPHIADAREMIVDIHHPVIGDMRINGNPVKLMTTKPTIKTPAPGLGQHNNVVYSEILGLDESEIKALKEKGTI